VYSTSDNINTIRKCKQIGVNLYVPKPVKVADIKKVIEQVTEIDWSNHQVTNENFVLRT
jgi:DNA-binding NarL/FixJ family response regulator